jgi:hypothetical protein
VWDRHPDEGQERIVELVLDSDNNISVIFADHYIFEYGGVRQDLRVSSFDQPDWQVGVQDRIIEGLVNDECLHTWDPNPPDWS